MSNSTTVRIPRDRGRPVVRIPAGSSSRPGPTGRVPPTPFRSNVAGRQRAVRLLLIYLVGLSLVFLVFAAVDRSVPGGTGAGATFDLLLFGLAALGFAIAGSLIALHPVPRRIGLTSDTIIVIGRWGRRTEWAPREQVRVRIVRRFPAGFLSQEPVESVELTLGGRPPRTYLVAEGLLPTGPETG